MFTITSQNYACEIVGIKAFAALHSEKPNTELRDILNMAAVTFHAKKLSSYIDAVTHSVQRLG